MPTRYKVLGQSAPGATTNTNLYTVPAGKDAIVSTLVISNRVNTVSTFRIAIRPEGSTIANQHYIAFDVPVGASDSTTLTLGISISATDIITVYASTANLSFSAFGTEIDI
jgi:hypothetical protein